MVLQGSLPCCKLTNLKTLLVVAWALAYGEEAEAALLRLFAFNLPMFATSWEGGSWMSVLVVELIYRIIFWVLRRGRDLIR